MTERRGGTPRASGEAGSGSRRPLWALSVGMGAAAAGLVLGLPVFHAPALAGSHLRVPFPVLAVAFAVAEIHVLHLHFRGDAHTFSLNEIVLVLGLFFTSPSGVVTAQLLGGAFVLALLRRQPALKLLFNLSQFALGTAVAVVVFRSISAATGPLGARSWVAALAACVASATISLVAIGFAIVVVEGEVAFRGLTRTFVYGLLGTATNSLFGLVAVLVLWQSPPAGLLLVGPIVVLFAAYRAYLSERSKSVGLQFLYDASQVLNDARDLEAGLVALLDFARDAFHAEVAELAVRGEDDDALGYRTVAGPGPAASPMSAVACEIVEPVLTAVASTSRAVLVEDLPARDGFEVATAMVAPLSGEGGVRGAVLVATGPDTPQPFGKDELRLFETFANHLGTTLEKAHLSTSLAQLRALKQELTYQAYHDSLTGLANRALFRDRVAQALERAGAAGRGVAVLFIDLDDFKTVNDTMGHAAGDALLEVVGRRIAGCVGPNDTAARLGGDEFAVLLADVMHEADARVVADRVLVQLGDPIEVDGQSVVAQASIGIATHAGAADASELMQNADVAMYTAKRNGKGRFDVFEPTMSLTVARRHQVKVGLERALAARELVLHYQPVVDVTSGQIIATEALLRWKEPRRGLLGATEFIGIAEETGLIMPIGRYVLHEACRQAVEWSRLAPDLRMFVNLSARQIADPDLFSDVCGALAASGLGPERLLLEVTETAMMQDIDAAKATLGRLKELGVGIGIDDFGTGFSSLSYLRQLPIDVLKIAKPIVDAVDESAEDAAFVQGIVALGHVVGVQVVAEGVERVAQSAHLLDMGCDLAQGHYYARSLEPADLDQLLRAALARPGETLSPSPN